MSERRLAVAFVPWTAGSDPTVAGITDPCGSPFPTEDRIALRTEGRRDT
jgi:hypothetical protein